MDGNLFSYQKTWEPQSARACWTTYVYMLCDKERIARHKANSTTTRVSQDEEKKIRKKIWFQVFFLPEIGRWLKCSRWIFVFENRQTATETTTKSSRKRQNGEQTQDAALWDAAEGLTEAKSDSGLVLVSSRSFLFRGEETRGSTSVRVPLDPARPILCHSKILDGYIIHFPTAHGGELLYRAVIVSLSSREGGSPHFFQLSP